MNSTPNEVVKHAVNELDALAEMLDFMAEAHEHPGGRYVLIYLSDRATNVAYDLKKQFELLEAEE